MATNEEKNEVVPIPSKVTFGMWIDSLFVSNEKKIKNVETKLSKSWFALHWHFLLLCFGAALLYWFADSIHYDNTKNINEISYKTDELQADSVHAVQNLPIFYNYLRQQADIEHQNNQPELQQKIVTGIYIIFFAEIFSLWLLVMFTSFDFLKAIKNKDDPDHKVSLQIAGGILIINLYVWLKLLK